MSFSKFKSDLDKVQRIIDAIPKEAVSRLSLEAKKKVETKTPVDTGFARANWELVPIARGKFPANKIQNDVPYILPLEFGHSRQAPNGMARLTVLEIAELAKKSSFWKSIVMRVS